MVALITNSGSNQQLFDELHSLGCKTPEQTKIYEFSPDMYLCSL